MASPRKPAASNGRSRRPAMRKPAGETTRTSDGKPMRKPVRKPERKPARKPERKLADPVPVPADTPVTSTALTTIATTTTMPTTTLTPATVAAQVQALVVRELAAVDRVLAVLGPQDAGEAERTARTLASLARTLRELSQVHDTAAAETDEPSHDDAGPRDLDEFRRELARRIDAFVGEQADGGVSDRPDGGVD